MRDRAAAGVGVALSVVGESEGPNAQNPGQVGGSEGPQRLPSAGCDLEALDVRGDLPAAGNKQKTAVRTPPNGEVLGSRSRHGSCLAPIDRIDDEGAAARLDEDRPAVGRHESLARSFRGRGARLAARDVLHVAPDPFAIFMTAGEDPSGVREKLPGLVADEAASLEFAE